MFNRQKEQLPLVKNIPIHIQPVEDVERFPSISKRRPVLLVLSQQRRCEDVRENNFSTFLSILSIAFS